MAKIDLVSTYVGFTFDLFDKGERNPAKIMSVVSFVLAATFFIYCVDKYSRYLKENSELKSIHLITGKSKNILLLMYKILMSNEILICIFQENILQFRLAIMMSLRHTPAYLQESQLFQ